MAKKKESHEKFIEMELLSTLTGEFFPDEPDNDSLEDLCGKEGEPLDGADLVQYEEAIRERVEEENQMDNTEGTPCNLMEYFRGSDAVRRKTESAVVSVKYLDGALYGCTTLKLKEPLAEQELSELKEYILGQYSDGWGEGFEQRDICVDSGTLNVHFWQSGGFRFLSREEMDCRNPMRENIRRPKLKLLGHDGNVFSIMGDARRLLIRNGQKTEADEMFDRVTQSDNYYQVLGIISEYVETELSPPVPKAEKKEKHKRDGDCR